MADFPALKPKHRKYLVWGGLGLVGSLMVYLLVTSGGGPRPERVEPEKRSLTGNVDTRVVSIEGLNTRLSVIEQERERSFNELRQQVNSLQQQLSTAINRADKAEAAGGPLAERANQQAQDRITALERRLATIEQPSAPSSGPQGPSASQRITDARPGISPSSQSPSSLPAASDQQATDRQKREEAERLAAEERRRLREIEDRERQVQLYSAPVAPPAMAQRVDSRGPAPRIAKFEGPEKPVVDSAEAGIPDLEVPAGSILSAFLLTGMEAPSGTRSEKNPLPVLMRIKLDAIMPNYARADVKECHLLGSAVGELATQRIQVRGETVSCILADNSALEGSVKFFLADNDGKAGLRGKLVTRSGQMLSRAAGAALAQGLSGALTAGVSSGSGTSVNLGGQSIASGAMQGAADGFDMLTEYYISLAEETFPVIEVPNGRWVDVILTEKMTIKFLRGKG